MNTNQDFWTETHFGREAVLTIDIRPFPLRGYFNDKKGVVLCGFLKENQTIEQFLNDREVRRAELYRYWQMVENRLQSEKNYKKKMEAK